MRISSVVLISVAMMLAVIGATASPIAEATVDNVRREVPREPGRGGYNRDVRDPGRGGYNRDVRDPGRGGYNRDVRDPGRGGYNREERDPGRGGYN
ncbi:uncharacterized protein EDB93DRAFT_1244493 [Suillus bovinus]|uniref:uncharacterized protein n=1 Tax=Suillus bovinus TaxID=48563 RepID=UPI001B86866D|nr:uncharacterized protein EDB93DRAFT_1244493 [Suillus bovinus]KAG2159711.1 hypothetical protein EDB93DRAFT_1244493 [Suillus bovinus]